ncbi:MAG: hypothetical protein LBI42_01690 [Chitinispirillales bacterium]|jgi:hypothetical protein|nr:hypothetical protein [Chitinispirillales bacterium]
MIRKLKTAVAILATAGLTAGVMAQVPMQTTQDHVTETANGPRLVINGQPLFISGMNLAWHNFARDIGDAPVNGATMANYIKQIRGAGGNAMRWWLHTDAQVDPKMDMNTGAVTGIGSQTINNMRTVLDTAYHYGVVVSMCLFSFDLLHDDGGNKGAAVVERNRKFLTDPANLDTYIQNALIPILDAVGNHPAIMCWEVFNEPEGMATTGWATVKIDHSHIMRFTARIAAAVHDRTVKMASTGIHNFHQYKGVYTEGKLKAAAGADPLADKAYLDFYMAHTYPEHERVEESPFKQEASHWEFDKPVLIGEFPAQDMGQGGYNYGFVTTPANAIPIIDAYKWAYEKGYLGAMSWSITEGDKAKFGTLATTAPALQYMAENYESEIKLLTTGGGVIVPDPTGDLAMRITFDGTNVDGNIIDKTFKQNLSGKTNITVEMYIAGGSGTNVSIHPVIQAGASWEIWAEASAVSLTGRPTNEWFTVTIPISSYDGLSAGLSATQGMAFKFIPGGSGSYSGTIYIDNIKVDGVAAYDFNVASAVWDAEGPWNNALNAPDPLPGVTVGNVARPGATSIRCGTKAAGVSARMPVVSVRGKVLNIVGVDNSEMAIRLIHVNGKTAANFKASGKGKFSLAKVPAGRYIVETKVAGKRAGSTAVLVR